VRVAFSVALLLSATAPALAQSSQAAATIQFDQGRALIKQGKFKEACDAFERSQKLDPQNGTLFNLAGCQEKIGKLATAWLAYRDLAGRDTNAKRKAEATKRAKDLDKRLPKLVLAAPEKTPTGLTVTLDGADAVPLLGIESPVDLGEHKIVAAAPGYKPFETSVAVKTEGKTMTIKLDLQTESVTPKRTPDDPDRGKLDKPVPVVDEQPHSTRRRNGAIAAAVGGVGIGVGVVFGLKAKGKWDDAEAICPDKQCPSAAAKTEGDLLTDDARSAATLSTVFFVGGAALTAIGVYFVVTGKSTAPTTALRFVPTTDGGAVVLGGRF